MTVKKTNVLRLLDQAGIAYQTHSYPVGAEHLDAVRVAQLVGIEPERVFKTLVASGGGTLYGVFVIPGVLELDVRKAATVSGWPRVELVRVEALTALTGYQRGGCSPLAMSKAFPTWIDETARLFERLVLSAGARGLQVELSPSDLMALCQRTLPRADWADLT